MKKLLTVWWQDHLTAHTLPRVSDEIAGKRPDHIIEIFEGNKKPILLSIESKERSANLESNVGKRLISYIEHLMEYVPNVERHNTTVAEWQLGKHIVNKDNYTMISAAAYLKEYAQSDSTVRKNSNCDMLFIMNPIRAGWRIEITSFTPEAQHLKQYLKRIISLSSDSSIDLR